MLDTFKQHIEALLKKAGVEDVKGLSVPPNADMGDFCLPCFSLAKAWGVKPAEAAQRVLNMLEKVEIESDNLVQDFSMSGPYVNFYLRLPKVAELVLAEVLSRGADYGHWPLGAGHKVVIEYPSQNTHKEFHIGHLRNVCIGNTLVQLYRAAGYDITPVNYINDFGAHVVKCLWGLKKFHGNEAPPENTQKWLGQIYAEASIYIKEHEEETKAELDELQKKLEAHDPEIWPLFETTRGWSLEGFDELHSELSARHTVLFLESEVKARGQQIVDELLAKGIAEVGDKGAVIIDLKDAGLDVALLRKGTGAGLYMTADLALAEEKFKRVDASESINITGIEQNFYFKQLFAVLDRYGFHKKMTHIGYGLVNRSDGKMSSRLGNVILYEELRDDIAERLRQDNTARHPDWTPARVTILANKLTQAVLKFTMLQHEAGKNISFDVTQAVSVEGYSAPYVLYVVARINSLLKKSAGLNTANTPVDVRQFETLEDKKLFILIASYQEVLQKALAAYNPSAVVKYSFDLAQAFNDLYAKHDIISKDHEVTRARLALAMAVRQVLINALTVLTIEPVEEM